MPTPAAPTLRLRVAPLLACCLALLAARAHALDVELRLVPHDRTGETVAGLERSQPVYTITSTAQGVRTEQVGTAVTSWARNVLIDDKPLFERYHEGRYVDRLPVATVPLAAGDHVIWPGNHVFSVTAEGALRTADPTLVIDGARVLIRTWPVTVRGMREGADAGGDPAPLPQITIRDATDAAPDPVKGLREGSRELLPTLERFAPLTIWLPANTVGHGYLLHPIGLSFHLGEQGVQPAAGGGTAVQGVLIDGSRIQVPMLAFPIVGEPLSRLVVTGVQDLTWERREPTLPVLAGGHELATSWYPRSVPYELRLDATGPALRIDGDLSKLPVKAGRIAHAEAVTGGQRLVLAELAERHLAPGQTLTARVRAIDVSRQSAAQRLVTEAKAKADAADAALAALSARIAAQEGEIAKAGTAATPEQRAAAAADAERRPALEKAIASAKEALAAATAAATAIAADDDAAGWTPMARIRAVDSGTWAPVPVAPIAGGAAGDVSLTIPAGLQAGAYQLEVGAVAPAGAPSLAAPLWVSVAEKAGLGIGTFTQRGRSVFRRGEDFWIAVGVAADPDKLPAGELALWLVDSAGTRVPVLTRSEPVGDGPRRTRIARITSALSAALAAGTYRIEASFAGQRAASRPIELVEADPATHFTNLLPGKYSSTSDLYTDVLRHREGAAELAAGIARLGFNAFMGMDYGMDRVSHPRQDLERVVRERPHLGPWEGYYQQSGRERFMDEALRSGLRFYENMFTYHDTQLPREPNLLGASERYVSLETASMRGFPAFTGVCLYDEFYWVAPEGIPPAVAGAMEAAEEVAFRQAHPTLSSDKAAKALERFLATPPGQRKQKDLEDGLARDSFRDRAWGDFSRRMGGAAKRVMPGSSNFTLQRSWGGNGGNLNNNGSADEVCGPLDAAATVMYKDGGIGDRPEFAPMQADAMRIRPDQTVWTQIFGIVPPQNADAIVRQAFFGLSQQVEGMSFFNFVALTPTAPAYHDNGDPLRNVTGLTTRYGDFLLSAKRGYRRVAVLYSRRADLLGSRKPEKLVYTCEGLWVACMRAGFPADFLYDSQLLAGEGDRYQAIFAPGFTIEQEADPATHAAIKRLVDSGKTVLVERASKLEIEGLVRLDSDLNDYDDKFGGAFPQFVDFEFDQVFATTKDMADLVKTALAKRIQPAAEHDLLVGPDWLAAGKGQYLVLPNFAPVGFTGSSKTLYQAPSVARLRFPKRPPACYDMLRMQRLEPTVDGDWMTLDLDMRSAPGAMAAFLPAAIGGVALQAPATTAGGAELPFSVSVVDAGGAPIDAGFPIEVLLTDGTGRLVHHVYRSAAPRLLESYRIGANGTVGTWKLEVRELISGRSASAAIQVTAGTLPAASLDERTVWMSAPADVAAFIARKEEVVIALSSAQAWARPQAERLATELVKRGRTARIVDVDAVIRLPNEWGGADIDGSRLWRGDMVQPGLFVDRDLILLGRRDENRLIEALTQRDVLPQQLSSGFPGAGKGLVDLTWRGFSNDRDTLTLLSIDEAGLARCVDAALGGEPNATVEPVANVRPEPSAPLAATSAGTSGTPQAWSALSARDWVRTMDVDAASGAVAIGTQGFGHNLFCFAADGSLRWKQFLPEHEVYYVRWCDAGRKIVAATARGWLVFILDAADGRVLNRLSATEWPPLHYREGPVGGEQQIVINEPLGQILVGGVSGLTAYGFDGRTRWFNDRAPAISAYPPAAEQTSAAEFGNTLAVGNFALSPDGLRIAHGEYEVVGSALNQKDLMPVWAYRPMLLDARTGAVLARNDDDQGMQFYPIGWSVSWPRGSDEPLMHTTGLQARLRMDGSRGPLTVDEGWALADGGALVRRDGALKRIDRARAVRWSTHDAAWMLLDIDALSPDQSLLYRCDLAGTVSAIDLADGSVRWTCLLPTGPALLQPTVDGVLCGTKTGDVIRLSSTGGVAWRASLGALHEQPASDYPGYVRAALERDREAPRSHPVGIDDAGDLDGVLRFGADQLQDGGFESDGAWAAAEGALAYSTAGRSGSRALALSAGGLATQAVGRRLVPYATYLLEFWYRIEEPGAFVTAGVESEDGGKPAFTGSRFSAHPGAWTFGRLALKTLAKPSAMKAGFEASGGRVAIDEVRLRAVRFPSANLLSSPDLAAIEPTHPQDPRFVFDRIPTELRAKLRQRNHVAAYKQGLAKTALIFQQEEAFLHNGRLDDVGPVWLYMPEGIGYSVALTKPAWISDLVIYLNNAAPDDTYRTISILANDLDTKLPREIALVRGNQRRFLVVHLPEPVRTDLLKILPLHPGHHESLTEIEVYGPPAGPGQLMAPVDAQAVPMAMGTPSHVPALPEDAIGTFAEIARQGIDDPAFHVGLTAMDGFMTVGNARGSIMGFRIPTGEKKEFPQGPVWNLQSVTPTTTPTRAHGCLLVGAADQRLHAVADDGTYLWGFVTGGRIRSAPLATGDDVFVGSDDGRLYKVDAHSGTLLWEYAAGGCVRGGPVLAGNRVCVAAEDGFLHAVDAETGLPAWKAPIAPQTRATAACDGDGIVIGDEDGGLHRFDAATGAERWRHTLPGRVSTCPLVTPEGIVFVADNGAAALVAGDGNVRWTRPASGILSGQPLATRSQVLLPTTAGVVALLRADGTPDPRFVPPAGTPAVRSLLSYRGDLLLSIAGATTDYSAPPRTYARYGGAAAVWRAVPTTPAGSPK